MIDRKVKIAQRVQQMGRVNVAELAEEYGVSTMTIRRDLARLEQEGLVTVEYGGAVLRRQLLWEADIQEKQRAFSAEKKRIAKAAASLVKEGDSVFLDAGTTVCEVARLLNHKTGLHIMTNSLLAANVLAANHENKLIMCPGEYRSVSMAFIGQITDEFVSAFRFDVLFLGVEGIADAIYVPDEQDGITKRKFMSQTDQVVCVADHSKIGRRLRYRIGKLEQISHLITDNKISAEQAGILQKKTNLLVV